MLEVVIYKFPVPCGLQVIRAASCLSFSMSTARIGPSPPRTVYTSLRVAAHHLRTFPNPYPSSFSYPPVYLHRWILLSESPPPFYSHTPIHCPPSLPPHPSLFLSLSAALCVLLWHSNFPFDFGGNAFFTNQRGSRAAPPLSSSYLPPSIPPSSSVFPPSPVSRSRPPRAPQAREEIKEPPSFPC